ncbi:MAG: phage terminase GpA family protein [Gemmatimonadetes bacterium]|nr:phage terminase GpA family protein [Gemmatimonadota bacterium]
MIALDGLTTLRSEYRRAAREVFQPSPRMTVSEWADTNRVLPETGPSPGRFKTSRVPYLRGIQDALSDDTIREVVFAKSAQVGGSTVGENFVGYLIDQAPCAILEVWPTEKKLKQWSLTRLDPMIDDTPTLSGKFPRSGRRDSGDSIGYKEFPGGWLKALTAKSTSDMKSDTARVAVAEEIDEWMVDVGGQGDPLELLRARVRNFWNSKIYIVSTPTLEGFSTVWTALKDSTWNEFWVPCPHPKCGHRQTLRWRDHSADSADGIESGAYRLIFERDADGHLIPGTTAYLCEGCGALIEEHHKAWMLEQGEWIPRHPGRRAEGFHINTIYSPLSSWDDIVETFLRAKTPEKMKTFVNTLLGLPFQEGEAVKSHFLAARSIEYKADVPMDVGLLTAGVDVQGDRVELFVWGWGADERSWVIAWEQIEGDPGTDEVWRKLDARLQHPWQHEGGATMRIHATCVDAGYQSERVWRFCHARTARRVIATVGRSGPRKLIEAPTAEKFKKSRAQKKPMHVIGTDAGKNILASRLRLTDSAAAGYVTFRESLDPTFYEQLVSERLITKYDKRGHSMRSWDLPQGLRNEALDGAVLAMGALWYCGMPVVRSLGELAKRVQEQGRLGGQAHALARPSGRRMRSGGVT